VQASVVVAGGLCSCSSQALEHRLSSGGAQVSCSLACGIFLNQGLKPCPLRRQVDSLLLSHQGSSFLMFLKYVSNKIRFVFGEGLVGLEDHLEKMKTWDLYSFSQMMERTQTEAVVSG